MSACDGCNYNGGRRLGASREGTGDKRDETIAGIEASHCLLLILQKNFELLDFDKTVDGY